jgi:putative addiction module antidote
VQAKNRGCGHVRTNVRLPVHALKITTTGNSLAIALPKAVVDRLKLKKGDEIFLVDTPDGVRLTPYDPEFDAQLNAARQVMRKYRNTLRALAK